MAIVGANVIVNQNTVAASSFATASVAPSANTLYLLTVASRETASATATTPTVTGAGLTWVQVATIQYDTSASSFRRLTVFRAMGSGSTGALTIDFAGQSQSICVWSLDSVTGVNTGGTNGSSAIVQSATAKDETSLLTSFSATLAAFGSASNGTFGSFGFGDPGGAMTFTAGAGFTKLTGFDTAAQGAHLATEWRADNSTTVGLTWTSSGEEVGAIGIELAAAPTGVFTKSIILRQAVNRASTY